jgi:hypothetical protein
MFAIATINASNGINTIGVIEKTVGLFEISFGVGKTTHKGKIRWNNVGILKKNA